MLPYLDSYVQKLAWQAISRMAMLMIKASLPFGNQERYFNFATLYYIILYYIETIYIYI